MTTTKITPSGLTGQSRTEMRIPTNDWVIHHNWYPDGSWHIGNPFGFQTYTHRMVEVFPVKATKRDPHEYADIRLKRIYLIAVWNVESDKVAYWNIYTYKYGYLGRTRNIKDFI